jgi:IclR family transcriptional regulator, acetate operon repressor
MPTSPLPRLLGAGIGTGRMGENEAMSPRNNQSSNDSSITALKNGLAVLCAFSVEKPLQGVSEIAVNLGLHKSTVSRILGTLEQLDLVERDPATRRFRLGLGLIALAGPMLANLDVRRVAYPVLVELSRRTAETAALMVWDGRGAVCVEQVPSRHQVKHTTPLGTRYHDAASSSVQVFLAQQDSVQVRALLMNGTITYPSLDSDGLDAYLARLQGAVARGYAVNYGETSLEEVGVAAPVFDHRGEPVAAVLVSAPRFRISTAKLDMIGDLTLDASRAIRNRLGGASA